MNKPFTIAAIILIIVLVIAQERGWIPSHDNPSAAGVSGEVKSKGSATIGGPFTLTSHTGNTISNADFAGKNMLLFFGFTNCPAICPTGLQTISQVMRDVPAEVANTIQPVFITVDVERDTPENIALYLENFDPRIVGLTGTQAQIDAVLKSYRAFAQKVETEMMGVMFDHSSYIYLMDKNGNYVRHFKHNTPVAEMIDGINESL